MQFLRAYQLDIMLFLAGVCAALSLLVLISKAIPKDRRIALLLMEIGSFILLVSDRFAYIFRGDLSKVGYYMVRVCNFLVFAISLFIVFSFNLILKSLEGEKKEKNKINEIMLGVTDFLILIGLIFLLVSRKSNYYYYFDAMNLYHRGEGIVFSYIFPLSSLILQIVVVIRNKSAFKKRIFIPLMLFCIVPLIATVVQIFNYGLSLTNISIVGASMLLYIFSLIDINQQIEEAKLKEIMLLKEEQEQMQEMFRQTAGALASSIDAKDEYTHGHSKRVAEYALLLARNAGKSDHECQEVYYAALLHDVGKIGIPDSIINKAGKLTKEEYETVKLHTIIGSQILTPISSNPNLCIGAKYHHERYDGRGYPEGLKGEEIPELARIIAVADAYDTMTSKRSYRAPLAQKLVREEIVKGRGSQFDPDYASIMIDLIDKDKNYNMREPDKMYIITNRKA